MTKRQPKMMSLSSPPPPLAAVAAPVPEPAQRSPLIDRLMEWRKKRELTQKETAARLEINFETYKAYEGGYRNPGGLSTIKILRLLGELK